MYTSHKETKLYYNAFPGITGELHIGHLRGYVYLDTLMKLERLFGIEANALIPFAVHSSGQGPLLLKNKRIYGQTLLNTNEIISHVGINYLNTIKHTRVELFEGTYFRTIDEGYQRMVNWQLNIFYDQGIIYQDNYYVPTCPKCGPVAVDPSETDVLSGGNALKKKITVLKGYNNKKIIYFQKEDIECKLFEDVISLYLGKSLWANAELIFGVTEKSPSTLFTSPSEVIETDIHYFSQEVICRCKSRVFLKKIEDQWFIDFDRNNIKERTLNALLSIKVFPEQNRIALINNITNFPLRAFTRVSTKNVGVFWERHPEFTIDPIIDSMIYPLYYLVRLGEMQGLDTQNFSDEFFTKTFIKRKNPSWNSLLKNYSFKVNLAGKEHLSVHFPVFLMGHVILGLPLTKELIVNSYVLAEGNEKISKSKRNAPDISSFKDFGEEYNERLDGLRISLLHLASINRDIVLGEQTVNDYIHSLNLFHLWLEKTRVKYNSLPLYKKYDDDSITYFNSFNEMLVQYLLKRELREFIDFILFKFPKIIGLYTNYLQGVSPLHFEILQNLEDIVKTLLGQRILRSKPILLKTVRVNENLIREKYLRVLIQRIQKIVRTSQNEYPTIKIYCYPNDLISKDKIKLLIDQKKMGLPLPNYYQQNIFFKELSKYFAEAPYLKRKKEFLKTFFGKKIQIFPTINEYLYPKIVYEPKK